MKAKVKTAVYWGLIILSLVFLVVSPLGETKDQLAESAVWLLIGVAFAEVLFIGGIALMAAAIGLKIRNPLKLRRELKNILRAGFRSRLFWIGFWVNAGAAVATMVLVSVGILTVLPPKSWGLLIIAISDIASTFALRHYILQKRNGQNPVPRGE